jgi:hypothetical protein
MRAKLSPFFCLRELSRLEAFKIIGPLLQSGQISRETMEKLIEHGLFEVKKGRSYYYLQKLH